MHNHLKLVNSVVDPVPGTTHFVFIQTTPIQGQKKKDTISSHDDHVRPEAAALRHPTPATLQALLAAVRDRKRSLWLSGCDGL